MALEYECQFNVKVQITTLTLKVKVPPLLWNSCLGYHAIISDSMKRILIKLEM